MCIGAFAIAFVGWPTSAVAQEPTSDPLRRSMLDYYGTGEHNMIAFMTSGSAHIVGGATMLGFDDPPGLRPAGIPLLAVGLAQLVGGAIVYTSDRARVKKVEPRLVEDRTAFLRDETEIVEATATSIAWVRGIESVLIIAGVTTGIVGLSKDIPEATGAGFGTAGAATTTLALDTWYAWRASTYLEQLELGGRKGVGMTFRVQTAW